MGKIAIVGCEASGKTVFMSALADHYCRDAAGGPCLVPENADANRFVEFQRRQMRALRQWPPATNPGRTVEMKWSLREKGRVIATVGMLEFGGETFRAAFRETSEPDASREAVKDLVAYLAEAEAVVALVSIKDLMRDPAGRSAEDFERDTEAVWVTRGLLDFVRRNLPHAAIVIGLTQADRYRDELERAGGARALFAARWPSVSAVAAGIPVIEVASVSATDEDGFPAPDYNTDGVLPVMNEVFRQLKSRRRRNGLRRTFLLLALLAATAYAALSLDFAAISSLFNSFTEGTVPNQAPCAREGASGTAQAEGTVPKTEQAEGTVPKTEGTVPNSAADRLARADAGDTASQRWVANRYYAGSDTLPRDLLAARRYYALAAEGGDARAQLALAVMLEKGEGGDVELAEAMSWYARAAEGGAADAMYRMGVKGWENRDVNTNALAEAHRWFERAKAGGCRIANLDRWLERTTQPSHE